MRVSEHGSRLRELIKPRRLARTKRPASLTPQQLRISDIVYGVLEEYQVYLEEARRELDDQRSMVRGYDNKARVAGATALAVFGLFGITAGDFSALWDLTKVSGAAALVCSIAAAGKAVAVLRTVTLHAPNLSCLAHL